MNSEHGLRRWMSLAGGTIGCAVLLMGATIPQPTCPNNWHVKPQPSGAWDDVFDCPAGCDGQGSAGVCKRLVQPGSWVPAKRICAKPKLWPGGGCEYALILFSSTAWQNCDCRLHTAGCLCDGATCGPTVFGTSVQFRQAIPCP